MEQCAEEGVILPLFIQQRSCFCDKECQFLGSSNPMLFSDLPSSVERLGLDMVQTVVERNVNARSNEVVLYIQERSKAQRQ